jgi:hypothetical protein
MNTGVSAAQIKRHKGLLASIKTIWKSFTTTCAGIAFLFEFIYNIGLCLLSVLMCVSLLSLIAYFVYSLIFK